MSFINQDFLLQSDPAHRLYHDYAIDCPIHDYHSHLSPARIRDNIPFENLSTIWLEGDHYKWRAMRTAGVDESFITGNAPDEEKFLAWATVVPKTIGNPLYHWTHMELLNPFGIDELLGADNALDIFNHCTHMLQRPELHPRGLLRHWNVKTACTTDDPVDDVSVHQEASNEFISVRPTFRPDNVFGFTGSANFNRWLGKLGEKNGHLPDSLDDLLLALESRASVFHKAGCTASDHGLEQMFQGNPDKAIAEKTFTKLKHLENPSTDELRHYRSFLMTELGHMYHRPGTSKQLAPPMIPLMTYRYIRKPVTSLSLSDQPLGPIMFLDSQAARTSTDGSVNLVRKMVTCLTLLMTCSSPWSPGRQSSIKLVALLLITV